MKNNKRFIGMDLHKRTSTMCVKDYDGNVIDRQKIPTDDIAVRTYLEQFADFDVLLALEPVSQWYHYADLIAGEGVDVHLAHPYKVKAIASARIKTDAIDASVLCDLLRTNLLPEAYFAPAEVRSWKEVVRFRSSLVRLRTEVKNKIHALLFRNGRHFAGSSLFGVRGKKWLHELELPPVYRVSLDQYLVLLGHLDDQIDTATKRVESTVTDHPQAKLLTSIPGISYISALTIMAEIGDIKRFPAAKQLMSYAGLVPATYSSGDRIRHGRITKQGSHWLRYILIEVAHGQIRCKKVQGLGEYYAKMQQDKGAGTAAVATARKLCAVIWRLLTDNRPFEERPSVGRSSRSSHGLSSSGRSS